jgi:hypothetical protein
MRNNMWFTNNDIDNIWFNQSGNSASLQTQSDTPTPTPTPLWEYGGQTSLGDTIDDFSNEGYINVSHPFDESGVPDHMRINENQEHCDFVNNEIENIHTEMNFANSQAEIDELYKKLDILLDLSDEENCN